MSEPLEEKPNLKMQELFTKSAVEKFQRTPNEIERKYLRHYNQLTKYFDDAAIHTALSRFGIPDEARVTVFGGFTGQFAESLRRAGMKVIFTDPLPEWIDQAAKKGFESYRTSVQELPRELLQRTDLFASFECYPDLIGETEFYYPMMRFMTTKYGILFAESKDTVTSMREEEGGQFTQEIGTFRRWFRPLYRIYGIKRKVVKTEHVNLYHIFTEPETKDLLSSDCRIMKAIYDIFPANHCVTYDDIAVLTTNVDLDQSSTTRSLERLLSLSDSIHAPWVKIMPFLANQFKGSLNIGSKRYYITS